MSSEPTSVQPAQSRGAFMRSVLDHHDLATFAREHPTYDTEAQALRGLSGFTGASIVYLIDLGMYCIFDHVRHGPLASDDTIILINYRTPARWIATDSISTERRVLHCMDRTQTFDELIAMVRMPMSSFDEIELANDEIKVLRLQLRRVKTEVADIARVIGVATAGDRRTALLELLCKIKAHGASSNVSVDV